MELAGTKYEAPNGLKFIISVQDACGVWQCLECGTEGFTDDSDSGRAEQAVHNAAVEHSHVCAAQRGR
jgi:hypothetical protein